MNVDRFIGWLCAISLVCGLALDIWDRIQGEKPVTPTEPSTRFVIKA
jgi:hypothetical protein